MMETILSVQRVQARPDDHPAIRNVHFQYHNKDYSIQNRLLSLIAALNPFSNASLCPLLLSRIVVDNAKVPLAQWGVRYRPVHLGR